MHNRNLSLACKRANEAWFPVNQKLLKKIREGLRAGTYDLDVDFLIAEIKSDFALFTHCLRALAAMVKIEFLSAPQTSNPVEFLQWAGITRLKKILLADDKTISAHSLENSNDVQTLRFQESMVSASTAEVLAEHAQIDPDIGFSTALLRQLGLTLVAWNYPKVYRRVFLALDKEKDLDIALTRELGFSPQLLGLAIARQWGLSPTLRAALGDDESTKTLKGDQAKLVKDAGSFLGKLCEIGEALARANDPEHYPNAKADWDTARKEIEGRLGYEGIRVIQEKVKENCENYLSLAPEIFKQAIEVQAEPRIHAAEKKASTRQNRYMKDCPPVVQAALEELYAGLNPEAISKENVLSLAQKVIPIAGFERGCIFLLDPESMTLVPRLKIGFAKLSDFAAVDCSPMAPADDPIVNAFRGNAPVLQRLGMGGSNTHFICSVVGQAQRAGVLYLELCDELLNDPKQSPLLIYKAMVQALNDCLNLK